MPRFFFHLTDGTIERDQDGTELETLAEARIQAAIFAGGALREDPKHVWKGQELRVEVTDEAGDLLFTVITLAIDSPKLARALIAEDQA